MVAKKQVKKIQSKFFMDFEVDISVGYDISSGYSIGQIIHFNDTGNEYYHRIDGVWILIGSGAIKVTYEELIGLTSASGLTSNQQYLLTDFQTVHYMFDGTTRLDEINTGALEPLLLTSSSTSDIYPICKSMLYPQDIIHYDFKSDYWIQDIAFANAENIAGTLIAPDLTNVTLITGYKGVIYKREDTRNNVKLGYDFRNVKFRRWNDFNSSGYYMGVSSTSAGVIDINDNIDCYTFNGFDEYNTYDISVKNVVIDNGYDTYIQAVGSINSSLSNTVFYLGGNDINYQQITCRDIKAGLYFEQNTFGNGNYNIIFGSGIFSMTFGNSNYDMTFGNSNNSMTFGNGNYYMTFGDGNYSSMTFGDNNYDIKFFSGNNNMTFGSGNYDITFENDNYYMTFGNSNSYLRFGNNNGAIVLGTYSGSTFSGITITNNEFKSNMDFNLMDFSLATHLTLDYYCEIYKRPDGTPRLKYIDDTDVTQIVNVNS